MEESKEFEESTGSSTINDNSSHEYHPYSIFMGSNTAEGYNAVAMEVNDREEGEEKDDFPVLEEYSDEEEEQREEVVIPYPEWLRVTPEELHVFTHMYPVFRTCGRLCIGNPINFAVEVGDTCIEVLYFGAVFFYIEMLFMAWDELSKYRELCA